MPFDSLSAFFHMAGHGSFVWSAWGISLAVLAALVWLPMRRHRRELDAAALRAKHVQE